jgi:hypothetical protein
MLQHKETLCEYNTLDHGIHEFIVMDFSRAGADALIERIQQIKSTLPSDDVSSMLIDSSGGTLPINYAFSRVRQIGVRSWRDDSRVAVIAQSTSLFDMLSNLLRILPRLKLRLFTPDKRQAALDWLRSS